MKTTVYFNDFVQAFRDFNRIDNFSADGLKALFDYLEEIEEETKQEIELNVIALCCEYSEMSIQELIDYYVIDVSQCETDYKRHEKVLDYMLESTVVVADLGEFVVFADF